MLTVDSVVRSDVCARSAPVRQALAGGMRKALALLAMGAGVTAQSDVMCWGSSNADTRLGRNVSDVATESLLTAVIHDDGTVRVVGKSSAFVPSIVDIPSFGPGVLPVNVAIGSYHVAVLTDAGTIVCWGLNDKNQCDLPAAPMGHKYVRVAASGGASAFTGNTYGLLDSGEVIACGDPSSGKLLPPDPPPGAIFTEIAAGGEHALALDSAGQISAWGVNSDGQCNVPSLPVNTTYVAIAAGARHSAALRSDGMIVAWGWNPNGQTEVPTLPSGITYIDVAANVGKTVALRSDGSLVEWPVVPETYGFLSVPSGAKFRRVKGSATGATFGAIADDGTLVLWGASNSWACNLVKPAGSMTLTAMAAAAYSCAATWSNGDYTHCAELDPFAPPAVDEPTDAFGFIELAAGARHQLARRPDGSIEAWGDNSLGQCQSPPAGGALKYTAISAGAFHSLALRSNGTLAAWGNNAYGQCNVPQPGSGTKFEQAVGGQDHTLARTTSGAILAWGRNSAGQCDVPVLLPQQRCVEVAAGGAFSLARLDDGAILAWGDNSEGQCNVPDLPAGTAYTAVAAGSRHSIALRSDGQLVAWGRNDEGQCDVPALPAGRQFVRISANPYAEYSMAEIGSDGKKPAFFSLSSSSWVFSDADVKVSAKIKGSGKLVGIQEGELQLTFNSGSAWTLGLNELEFASGMWMAMDAQGKRAELELDVAGLKMLSELAAGILTSTATVSGLDAAFALDDLVVSKVRARLRPVLSKDLARLRFKVVVDLAGTAVVSNEPIEVVARIRAGAISSDQPLEDVLP